MHKALAVIAGLALALVAGCGGSSGSGGGTFVNPPASGNSNPTLAVTGMSAGAGGYTLAVQTGNPLPGPITVTASDSNAGDSLQLSVAFNPSASSGFADIPAQVSLSPAPVGSPKFSTATASAPGQAVVTISPAGNLASAGTLVFSVTCGDGQGGMATTQLSILVTSTPVNNPPSLGTPTGPGTVGGTAPSHTTSIQVGQSLACAITATDPDAANTLTVTATVTGGSLTASQAGFSTTFPATASGGSPRTLNLAGTAANAGTINLSFTVSDGAGGSASRTLAITITPVSSGGTGSGGTGGAYPGNQSRSVTVSGAGTHTYYLYIPNSYNPSNPVPVMFGFHGSGGAGTAPSAAQSVRTGWSSIAESEGFIVVAQAATGSGGGWVPSTDTVILDAIITDVWNAYNINTKRNYAWGFSAGGHYVHALGLNNNTFFAAYGVSAGALDALAGANAPATAAATRRIPCDIHIGNTDSLLTYAQADRTRFLNAGWVEGTNLWYTEFSGGHTYTTTHLGQIWNNIKTHSLP